MVGWREGEREGGGEGWRDGGRDGGREGGREGGEGEGEMYRRLVEVDPAICTCTTLCRTTRMRHCFRNIKLL